MNLCEKTVAHISKIKHNVNISLEECITKEITKHMQNLTLSQIMKSKDLEYTNVKIYLTNKDYVNLLNLMSHKDKTSMFNTVCKNLGFYTQSVHYSYDGEYSAWTISDNLYFESNE